ncbi:MAG: hypothetical protein ACOH2F_04305 [Cellulomonas sp.]
MSESSMSENTMSEQSENSAASHKRKKMPPFDASAVTRAASDALSVRRVFGEAYEHNGTWVIPVAKVMGGTGSGFGVGNAGGGGAAPGRKPKADVAAGSPEAHGEAEGSGGGGGFGVQVRPIGVYVVDDAGVHWRPSLDLNRVIIGGQIVGIVVSLTLAWILRRRFR